MDPKDQIKAKIEIVPFIQEYIPLKQMGRNFKTTCPFHGEKTPSFVVSPERQIWHCFGCQKGGDIFTFLMEYEKLTFFEALKTLAKRAGVTIESIKPGKDEEQKERLFAINHLASEFYHYLLTKHTAGEVAREYLEKRGITEKSIETFKLGFAPNSWESLFDYLTKKKNFSPFEIEQAGLIIKSSRQQGRYYDRFRSRIMFTLFDHRGNVVGFAGRVLQEAPGQAKYVNTPETPLYHKGELFYGFNVTKEAIKKEGTAIIVEGEFDVIQSFQSGTANVIAVKGTALTEMQVKLLHRFTQNMTLALDVDLAGDKAARRGIEIADKEGFNIKVIQITDGKDPDEAIRKNIGAWHEAIKHAASVYDFLIDSAIARSQKDTPEGKRAISDEVLPILARISNEIVKAHFVKRLSQELEIGEDAIEKAMSKFIGTSFGKEIVNSPVIPPVDISRHQLLEEYFLALLLQKGDNTLFQKVRLEVEPSFFHSAVLRKIFEQIIAHYEKEQGAFSIGLFVEKLPKELVPTVDRLYLLDVESITFENIAFELERVIREIRLLLLKKQMEELTAQVRLKEKAGTDSSTEEEELNTLSSQLHELTQSR